jgi:outer membrane protein assembly factor BamB
VLSQTIVAISVVRVAVGSGVRYEVRLLEFDKASGAPRRTVDYGTAIPVAMRKRDNELVVVRLEGTAIELLNLGTLTSSIVANAPASITAAALTKTMLFVASAAKGSTTGNVQAIAVDTWKQIWSRQVLPGCTIFADETDVVLAQSQAYDSPVDFRCLDARTGTERWSVKEGNRLPLPAAGLFSGGRFITQPRIRDTQPDKTLTVIYEATSGREIARFDSPFSDGWVVEADKFVLSCHWDHIFAFDLARL